MPRLPVSGSGPDAAPAGAGAAIPPETHRELLRDEYMKLQDVVEQFDERALQIKGWSVTVSLAGMAAAIVADIDAGDKALAFFLAGVGAAAFWLIEFFWKCFQWTFFHRIDQIEQAFATQRVDEVPPLQIRTVFHDNFKKDIGRNLAKAFKPWLMLPHALIAAVGFALAAIYW